MSVATSSNEKSYIKSNNVKSLPSVNGGLKSLNMESLLRELAIQADAGVGIDYFKSVLKFLSEAINMEHALIAELYLKPGTKNSYSATTCAYMHKGKLKNNFKYDLENTPCQNLVNTGKICTYEDQVARKFPEDKILAEIGVASYIGTPLYCSDGSICGLLVLMDSEPLTQCTLISDLISVTAHRVATELERIRSDRKLQVLSQAVEQSSESIIITNREGTIEYVNKSFEDSSGYRGNEVIGQNPRMFQSGIHSEDFYKNMWDNVLHHGGWTGEINNRKKNGELYWERTSIYPIQFENDSIERLVAIKEDITEKLERDRRLRMSLTVFEHTSEAIFITDSNNVIEYVNPAFIRITGYSWDEIVGKTPSILSSGTHDQSFYDEMYQSLQKWGRWVGEISNRRKDGDLFDEWLSIIRLKDDLDKTTHYVAMFSDITKHKKNEALLYEQANYDSLTGLPKKSMFVNRLREVIRMTDRRKQAFAVILINLDDFKRINDTLGHNNGDRILQMVAHRISRNTRETDMVSRLVSDEFTVLMHSMNNPQDVAIATEHLLAAIREPLQFHGRKIFLTATIGIAMYPSDGHKANDILKCAATAMHEAQLNGRNRYCFYTESMNHEAEDRLQLESELRDAIDKGQLEAYFQPIVDCKDQHLVGAEALVRWNHPSKGLLSPDIFIPLAEQTRLIIPIGLEMVRQVCNKLHDWNEEGLALQHVSVNLSPTQCADIDALKEIFNTVINSGINTEQLVFEITESLIIESNQELINLINQFRDNGIRFSVDDFGTGYSSLSYLKQFPMDILKIDREFISGICDDKNDAAMVKAIIAMANSLDLETVAEGVEQLPQLQKLSKIGCDKVQGYYIKKPVCHQSFSKYVREKQSQEGLTQLRA